MRTSWFSLRIEITSRFPISSRSTSVAMQDAENVQGYIYTDRPIYRPNHKVFFKGILRAFDEQWPVPARSKAKLLP